jgi:nucleoid DNA-binding protein
MNKNELIKRVAEKLDDVPRKVAARAVEAVFESIAEGLQEDGVVTIGKWGTYSADEL